MAPINLPLLFGSICAGAVVIDYGVKNASKAFANESGGTGSSGTPGTGGIIASLFKAGAKVHVSRKDQGRDLEGPPRSPIFANGSGHVISVGNNPGGFGIAYPIVHFDTGPWAGLDVYFGHIRSAVKAGESFAAGQVLGTTGDGSGPYVGNATGIPGHVEIGLAPGGSPGPWGQALPPGL